MQGQTIETKITVDAAQAAAEVAKFNGSLSSVEANLKRAGAALPAVEKGSSMAASKMLILGQAVDDAQYGLRGIVNNMPQVTQAFGGSMGLAGAVGIAAVVVSQLYDKYQQYNAIQKEVTENMGLWRHALDDTTKLMRESTIKSTDDLIKALKDAQTEIRNFGKTAQEVRMMDAQEALASTERTLSILEKNLPRFEEAAKVSGRGRKNLSFLQQIGVEEVFTDQEKEDFKMQNEILSTAKRRREELTAEIKKQKDALSGLEVATKKINELEKKDKASKEKPKEAPQYFLPFDPDVVVGNMEIAEERLRKFGVDSAVSIAKSTDQMLTDIATRGADVRLSIAQDEAQSLSGIVIGSLGGLDQIAMGATSTVASGLQQMTTDMLTGQEYIAERFGALVMQQAGQSLISSGTSLVGKAVESALTPGAQPIAVAQATAAAGLIAAGVGLGGVAAGLGNIAGGGSFNKPKDKSGERDKGVAPRSSRERGGGGPLVINVSYGVGGPLPEDTAREIAKVQRQGARRGGA